MKVCEIALSYYSGSSSTRANFMFSDEVRWEHPARQQLHMGYLDSINVVAAIHLHLLQQDLFQ